MTILASRMAKLDMRAVSEKTYSSIVAIAISAQPGLTRECIAAAAGSDGLDLVHQLKEHHSSMIEGELLCGDLPIEYPQKPASFLTMKPQLYEKAYRDGEPMDSQVDPVLLARLKAMVPCRNSKGSVQKGGVGETQMKRRPSAIMDGPESDPCARARPALLGSNGGIAREAPTRTHRTHPALLGSQQLTLSSPPPATAEGHKHQQLPAAQLALPAIADAASPQASPQAPGDAAPPQAPPQVPPHTGTGGQGGTGDAALPQAPPSAPGVGPAGGEKKTMTPRQLADSAKKFIQAQRSKDGEDEPAEEEEDAGGVDAKGAAGTKAGGNGGCEGKREGGGEGKGEGEGSREGNSKGEGKAGNRASTCLKRPASAQGSDLRDGAKQATWTKNKNARTLFHKERSRSQVLCRPANSKSFTYKYGKGEEYPNEKAAVQAATAWLKKPKLAEKKAV